MFYTKKYGILSKVPYTEIWLFVCSSIHRNMASCLKLYALLHCFSSEVPYKENGFLSEFLCTEIWFLCLKFYTQKYGFSSEVQYTEICFFCLKFHTQKYGFSSEIPYTETWYFVGSSIHRNMFFCLQFHTKKYGFLSNIPHKEVWLFA